MDPMTRIEQALDAAVTQVDDPDCPSGLAAAVRYAVFPGGARVRPRLCLAVAAACGDGTPAIADAAAASIELLHCASLVHDDLPCFDDAPLRRGRPSVHAAFGQQLAVLTGDALIVLAFETLARGCATEPARLVPLTRIVGRAAGVPRGIVAGQAWECEPQVSLAQYQRFKTGALFSAATLAGAVAAGAESGPWLQFGERLGEAYQVADDIRDVAGDAEELGKPTGRDAVLERPNAVRELGMAGAVKRFRDLVGDAIHAIPPCPGGADMPALIRAEVLRLLPKQLARSAA